MATAITIDSNKPYPSQSVNEMSSMDDPEKSFPSQELDENASTYTRRTPWLGVCCLLGVLLAAGAAAAALVLSNNRSSTRWIKQLPPNVILAGVNSVANICLAIAVGQGVAIAWWRKAARGATIRELHRSYGFSSSIKEIVLGARHLNVIAVAALSLKLAIVDSILLQRATSTYVGSDAPQLGSILGVAAKRFPVTGVMQELNGVTVTDKYYKDVIQTWASSDGVYKGMEKWFPGCENGVCYTYIEAAGFEVKCESSSKHLGSFGTAATNAYYADILAGFPANSTQIPLYTNISAFYTSWDSELIDHDYPGMVLDYAYIQNKTESADTDPGLACPTTRYTSSCLIRPAFVKYPITVTNHTGTHSANGVSMGWASDVAPSADFATKFDPSNNQLAGVNVTGYPSLTSDSSTGLDDTNVLSPAGTMNISYAGIKSAMSGYLSSNATLDFFGPNGWLMEQSGYLVENQLLSANSQSCAISFEDPIDYIVGKLNLLAFGTAILNLTTDETIRLGTNVTYYNGDQTVHVHHLDEGYQILDVVFYNTNYRYLAGALASMVACVLCVLPAYWGYWELPHDVSLGPFEIANAFRAPILERANTDVANAGIKDLMKEVGKTKVQYGVMTAGQPGRLAIAEPENVERVRI